MSHADGQLSPGQRREDYISRIHGELPTRERIKPSIFRSDYFETRKIARGNFANDYGYSFKDKFVWEGRANPDVAHLLLRPPTRGGFHASFDTKEIYGLPTTERGVVPVVPKWQRRDMNQRELSPRDRKVEYLSNMAIEKPLRDLVRPTKEQADYHDRQELAQGGFSNEGRAFDEKYPARESRNSRQSPMPYLGNGRRPRQPDSPSKEPADYYERRSPPRQLPDDDYTRRYEARRRRKSPYRSPFQDSHEGESYRARRY